MCGWPPAHRTTVSPSSPRRRRSRSEAGTRNRGLIALRYGADLTAKQIAEVLGVKTNAVEVALHRALGRLIYADLKDGELRASGSPVEHVACELDHFLGLSRNGVQILRGHVVEAVVSSSLRLMSLLMAFAASVPPGVICSSKASTS